jgi:hypothetical protein
VTASLAAEVTDEPLTLTAVGKLLGVSIEQLLGVSIERARQTTAVASRYSFPVPASARLEPNMLFPQLSSSCTVVAALSHVSRVSYGLCGELA